MTYLVDTMVISERSKSPGSASVNEWLGSIRKADAFLSVVTIGEIERGIRKLEQREGRNAERHRAWLNTTLQAYEGRILPVTLEIARRWGTLSYDLRNSNPDLLIAATALEHGLTVATRNVRHFRPTGVKLLNPYEA